MSALLFAALFSCIEFTRIVYIGATIGYVGMFARLLSCAYVLSNSAYNYHLAPSSLHFGIVN